MKNFFLLLFSLSLVTSDSNASHPATYLDQFQITNPKTKGKVAVVSGVKIQPEDQGISWATSEEGLIAACLRAQSFESLKYSDGYIDLKVKIYKGGFWYCRNCS